MLSDKTIRGLALSKGLINPFDKKRLQPASYDLSLGCSFINVGSSKITDVDFGDVMLLEPNDFVLGTTIESVSIPADIVGRVEGKSSLGRIGLLTHATAGFIDPGFNGKITLELKNIGPKTIALNVGCNIAQICFEYLDVCCENPYNSNRNHYQDQDDVVPSRYDFVDGVYVVN